MSNSVARRNYSLPSLCVISMAFLHEMAQDQLEYNPGFAWFAHGKASPDKRESKMLSAQPTMRQKFIAGAASVLALLGAANIPSANAQELANSAPLFTTQECRIIAATATDILRVVGSKTSVDFRQSLVNFIMPGGQMNCNGPRQIVWRTQDDAAAFNVIQSQLASPASRISLERAGVTLTPRPVASLQLQ